jgi:hypothetical protein
MAVTGSEPSPKPRSVFANDWFVVGAVFVIIGLLMAAIGLYLHFRKKSAPAAGLAGRAHALSRELYDFLAERRRDDPTLKLHLRSSSVSEEERHQRWIESTVSTMEFYTETMNRYGQRFEARALAIFDAAAKAGLADPRKRVEFEHPTNPLGIQRIAQRLGTIGHAAEAA